MSFAKNTVLPFQLLLKGCTIEAVIRSLVVSCLRFQLLLKGCTIEAMRPVWREKTYDKFQLLLKGCTIEAPGQGRTSPGH